MTLTVDIKEKKFDGKLIFKDFFYQFSEVGVYAITGISGVGKTTLLRIIAGLDKNFKGEIKNGGFKNVSFAFQEHRLFPELNAIDNIVSALSENDKKIKEQAENLLSFLDFQKNDLLLFPSELSGGMKQRVSLVRAILKNSPVLILDEPTKELDDSLKKKLYSLITEEGKRRLVIFVSHNKNDIQETGAKEINL